MLRLALRFATAAILNLGQASVARRLKRITRSQMLSIRVWPEDEMTSLNRTLIAQSQMKSLSQWLPMLTHMCAHTHTPLYFDPYGDFTLPSPLTITITISTTPLTSQNVLTSRVEWGLYVGSTHTHTHTCPMLISCMTHLYTGKHSRIICMLYFLHGR